MYRFPWYLMLVSTNHASSNPGLVAKSLLYGVGKDGTVHQSKQTQRKTLVYKGHILYFLELGAKDKILLGF